MNILSMLGYVRNVLCTKGSQVVGIRIASQSRVARRPLACSSSSRLGIGRPPVGLYIGNLRGLQWGEGTTEGGELGSLAVSRGGMERVDVGRHGD